MYARDERTGFHSIKDVWNEMGWDGEKIWRDTVDDLADDQGLQQLPVPGQPDAPPRAARA